MKRFWPTISFPDNVSGGGGSFFRSIAASSLPATLGDGDGADGAVEGEAGAEKALMAGDWFVYAGSRGANDISC